MTSRGVVFRGVPKDDRFVVRVPLASEMDQQVREMFRSPTPVKWPGRDPEVGYWVESITETAGSAWVIVTVARAGKFVTPQ